jgi:hypothetical protein
VPLDVRHDLGRCDVGGARRSNRQAFKPRHSPARRRLPHGGPATIHRCIRDGGPGALDVVYGNLYRQSPETIRKGDGVIISNDAVIGGDSAFPDIRGLDVCASPCGHPLITAGRRPTDNVGESTSRCRSITTSLRNKLCIFVMRPSFFARPATHIGCSSDSTAQ